MGWYLNWMELAFHIDKITAKQQLISSEGLFIYMQAV